MQTTTHLRGVKILKLKVAKQVGGGRVYPFPARCSEKNTIDFPVNRNTDSKYIEPYQVNGDSMESGDVSLHIGDGWIVLCRFKFEKSEIFNYPCLVRINGKDLAIKWISPESNGEGMILTCNNPKYKPEIYDPDCVEILAVAESSTRSNKK